MAQSTDDKRNPASFQLRSPSNVRKTLARLFRLRYAGTIDSGMCRDLVYIAKVMLEHDRHLLEQETSKRLDLLEQYIKGDGATNVQAADIDNPYAKDLKKKLANESKVNSELNAEILNLKRQLADTRAFNSGLSTDISSVAAS